MKNSETKNIFIAKNRQAPVSMLTRINEIILEPSSRMTGMSENILLSLLKFI